MTGTKRGAIGQIIAGGREELAVILSVSRPDKDSLFVYEMNNDFEVDVEDSWAFAPQPDWVFLADITGNGDEEVFFLRNFPNDQEGPRLIMRDDWGNDRERNEELIEWALMEGGDRNEFRRGAGGDVDGDGKDEIVIIRDDRIRIFHRPENGEERESDYDDHDLDTNRDTIVIGDLDTNGFVEGPTLATDKTMIDATVAAGTVSGEYTIAVTNFRGCGIQRRCSGWHQLGANQPHCCDDPRDPSNPLRCLCTHPGRLSHNADADIESKCSQ